jgi:Acetyltransferase (isoleucine patch superfamily)
MIKEFLLAQPFIAWLFWCFRFFKTHIQNNGKHIKIAANAVVVNSKVSKYNAFHRNARVFNCSIGKYTYISSDTVVRDTTIGNFCSIGPGCKIGTRQHPTNYISTSPAFFSTNKQCGKTFADKNTFQEILPITIGNDVWIGANVIIVDGVSIGDGAIIAAGAVVNKDVAPYTIVGGVPARIIKNRFSEDKIAYLLKLQWWNKNEEWLQENWELFSDSESFFSRIKI